MYDWTDDDVNAYATMCRDWTLDPSVLLHVWQSESGLDPTAHCAGGASGLCQFEPGTLDGLGYNLAGDVHLEAFRELCVAEQLPWVRLYYLHGRPCLGTVAGAYAWTFLPAQAHLAADPAATLCAREGPYAVAYRDNRPAFDADNKGHITGADLAARAARAWSPRAEGILSRVQAVLSPGA